MQAPWWFAIGFIAVLATVVAMNYRFIRGLRDKIKSGRAEMDDEWNPFE